MTAKMTINDTPIQTPGTMQIRLQHGAAWLTKQHNLYLANDPAAASNQKFGAAMAAWDNLEQLWRCAAPTGCVMNETTRCGEGSVVQCDACVVVAE